MAKKRMFSEAILNSDAFMDMPLSAQMLYVHLNMRADDDGFVASPKRIRMLIGAGEDDMKLLIAKRFILVFQSGVIVIKHWRLHNYIKNDRYKPTLYQEEKKLLSVKKNGVYTDRPLLPEEMPAPKGISDGTKMEPECIQNGTTLEPQVRLGKDRLELGKVSLELDKDNINNNLCDDVDTRAGVEAVRKYFCERCLNPKVFFGTTEALMDEVGLITEEIFKRLATRKATSADVSEVFHAITVYTPDPTPGSPCRTISQNNLDLLLYAFEQAVLAGIPGNWNYINGVLAKLAQRGIHTLARAEAYDDTRGE